MTGETAVTTEPPLGAAIERYLVVGYGNIGQRRARLLGRRCVGTVDPAVPGASHRSLDHIASGTYDAVVLATPNDVKLDYLRHFLAEGRPVLVEKPLLLQDRDAAEDLLRGARRDAIWYTAYNHRFEPLVVRLRALLHAGGVGRVDRVRMRYGNGTVEHWRGTWRESGAGVLEDLGCHLLDLAAFLLGDDVGGWELLDLRSVESATDDYALFRSADRRVLLEVGTVFWKNTFEIEVHGSEGSAHLDGLDKWGRACLVQRTRVRPSGVPLQRSFTTTGPDRTWDADLAEFERRVAAGESSLGSDLRISQALASLRTQAEAVA